MHFGTAVMRWRAFIPTPALVDFSAFYASAAAIRQGLSPYGLSADWLKALQTEMLIPGRPPVIYNPPLWPWLLQPLSALRYPSAAWLWLLCNLGLLLWVALTTYKNMAVSIHSPSRHILPFWTAHPLAQVIFFCAIIITFGPVFLDLSIGQTSVLLLVMCLTIGRQLRSRDSWRTSLITALAVALAAVAKLYPAIWLASLVMMRRWKHFLVSLVVTAAALSAGFILLPEGNREYWQQYLPQRLSSASSQVSMDDQSLVSWLDRVSRPHTYSVPGVTTSERERIVWAPIWELDPLQVQVVGYGLCALMGLPIIYLWVRSGEVQDEGKFYLWVLTILAIFPHMERYNHALLLPAMFWLWAKGRQRLVLAVYILAGLSRLNHVWILFLPAPWGPLASGFGLFAVIAMQWGIVQEFNQRHLLTGRR